MNVKPNKPIQQTPTIDWKLIISLFLVFIVISYFFNIFGGQKSIKLPYSTFKKQIKDGNISEIVIKGQEITGKFDKDYQQVIKAKKDTLTYKAFSTVKPEIDDPELMKILEEK